MALALTPYRRSNIDVETIREAMSTVHQRLLDALRHVDLFKNFGEEQLAKLLDAMAGPHTP